jgi:energy-coupling factor transport system ATP-binding protein
MHAFDFKHLGGYKMEIYRIKAVNFSYPEAKSQLLTVIHLTILEGDFVVVCGKSGSGKTTLLRHLKTVLTPHGESSGDIYFFNELLTDIDMRTQVADIGFVSQNPEAQIVTDKVWHELAFGLESLGYDQQTIRLRVAEMANFFGIQNWFMQDVSELSGGQKQLLNLASVMVMQPKVLILDEPTSQLDPIAASEFLETVKKINLELGVTVILTEHRLEEAFVLADKVIMMEQGRIRFYDTPRAMGEALKMSHSEMLKYMPAAMQIYAEVKTNLPCPITVRDGRRFLNQFQFKAIDSEPVVPVARGQDYAVELSEVYFKYEKNAPDILTGLNVKVVRNELYAILGGNGTGKSTTLSIIARLQKAYRGKIKLHFQSIGMLPQNPSSLFVKKTVEQELMHVTKDAKKVSEIVRLTKIVHLLAQHPYDLSGGEQQRLAIGKVLLLAPDILLLDEPTKGLDNEFKQELGELLLCLKKYGTTIMMVSHDVEFCARFADTCGLMFQGQIISEGSPRDFFGGNSFYTTAANRMVRHLWPDVITTEGVIQKCKQ